MPNNHKYGLQALDPVERATPGSAGVLKAARQSYLRSCTELARAQAACEALGVRSAGLAKQLQVCCMPAALCE